MSISRRRKWLYLLIALTFLLFTVAGLLEIQPARAASLYTDISLGYYNRFFNGMNTENFQRYHVLKAGYETDTFDINFNFNMFEDVNGPLADHDITPYTLETTWQATDQDEVEANLLYLIDVYSKDDSFVEAIVESKYKHMWSQDNWGFCLSPILRLGKDETWSFKPSLGAGVFYHTPKAAWSLELNGLDIKDYAIFGRGTNVLTAKVKWPTWNGTAMSIGLNALLGSPTPSSLPHCLDEHQEAIWVDIRVFFDHLAVFHL
jgi:hypothetical protein